MTAAISRVEVPAGGPICPRVKGAERETPPAGELGFHRSAVQRAVRERRSDERPGVHAVPPAAVTL